MHSFTAIRVVHKLQSLAFILAAITVAGCGAKVPYESAHLAGTFTINKQPVQDGSVSFLPASKGPAVGSIVKAGRYDCPHVPRGLVRVQFHAMRDTGKFDTVGNTTFPIKEVIVPEKYRAGVELEVREDNLALDFDLE